MQIAVDRQKPITSPPAAPVAPAAPVEAPVELSEGERVERAKELYAAQGWGHPPEKPAGDAPAATIPAAPAAPVPGAAPAPAPTVQLTQEQLIQRTASETARQTALEVSKVVRPPSAAVPPKPVVPPFEMTSEDADDYRVIQFLESTGDTKFKGKSTAFLDYVKKHYAYQEEWAHKNAGKEFDAESDEHTAWYDENQPDINPDDLEKGRIDIRVEERYQATVKPQLDAMKAKDAFEQNLPMIAHNVTTNIVAFTKEVDPELAKLVTTAEGTPDMTEDNVKKLVDRDPIAGEIMDEIVRNELEPLLLELEKTTIPEMNYRLNPAKNQAHAIIDQFRQKVEKDIQGDASQIVVDGKEFVTLREMQELRTEAMVSGTDEEKTQKLGELEVKYWTVTVDHVESAMVKTFAEKAKKRIEKADRLAKSKYSKQAPAIAPTPAAVPTPTPATAAAPAPAPAPAAIPSGGKPKPPSMSPQTEVVTSPPPGSTTEKTFSETATRTMFG